MKDIIVASISICSGLRCSYYAANGRMIKLISTHDDDGNIDTSSKHEIGCYRAALNMVKDTYGESSYAPTLIACWRAVIKSKEV